ncbi:MAG: hypothetical protein Tsb0021_16530 [Chlamydiales bacterium]
MKHKQSAAIFLSGLVWLVVGIYLLTLGLELVFKSIQTTNENQSPVLDFFSSFFHKEWIGIAFIAIALIVGYYKGRYILSKSALRISNRILLLSKPLNPAHIYPWTYYLLVGGMILLGMSFKFLGFPNDVRGIVDITIGAALINGALAYFKIATSVIRA